MPSTEENYKVFFF